MPDLIAVLEQLPARQLPEKERQPSRSIGADSQDETFELVIGDEDAASNSSSDGHSTTSDAQSEFVEAGSEIIVDSEFMSDSQDRVLVPKLSRGTVVEVDDDGDALVDFAGVGLQWVKRKRFTRMVVVCAGGEQDGEVRQAFDIRDGCLVQVARPLVTASERSRVLRAGLVGVVEEVDDDGDALIKFEGMDGFEWINKVDFNKLRSGTPGS
mmetsp:Transcript_49675/g.144436  ORF Transcript_49675/g.144436 Transcript_49675/m.144436 type:complete len:211 (-) Transcript_49675:71-703(-)